ncbi:usg protein [Fodinicurvata sediminis]|uniref:usg protein n=1 Tax=Fodinicurvata sediminis TaxID=1121832 RepID=UPI0003B56E43|nr:usg protein [Fodinicurvata sediminis]
MNAVALQLRDYRLTTAEILYHMPDHPGLLQTFVWQEYDLAPKFPELRRFLNFWSSNLEGKLHSVKVANQKIISASDWMNTDCELTLH